MATGYISATLQSSVAPARLSVNTSTKTAGVRQSNGTTLSDGRNAREAYPLNKLSINATEFLQYVIQPGHETSPDSILQAPSNA